MNRRDLFAVVPLMFTGCFLQDFTTVARPQIPDTDPDKNAVQSVNDVAAEWDNASEMVVSGFGLVTGLDGTGGSTPPCDARTVVFERLKRAKVENPSAILDSPDSAVVIVSAIVKPGVRRDELIDVAVTLPDGSRVKSLRGGILQPTPLMTFASQGEVRENLAANGFTAQSEGNRVLKGHDVVMARGTIQAALSGTDDAAAATDQPLKRGFVWKGGKLLDGRPLYMILKTDQQRYRVAEQVAARLNETFHAGEGAGTKVAIAKHKDLVAVAVPPRYRLNRPHYMRVVWAVPLTPPADTARYVRELEEKLQRPETALAAAIKLEALGQPGMPALKNALTSEYPLVRFASAEALAYLGNTAAAEPLAKIAAEHPALQAYALTALAALDDALGASMLEELLIAKEPELRYGAFRALREVDPTADSVHGVSASRAYSIHEVGKGGSQLVHLLTEGRAEIVLFGDSPKLVPPFSLTAGPNITVTARAGDTVATVSRFSPSTGGEPVYAQCSLALADVLKTMAEVGGMYPDAADMLQKANARKALTCRVVMDKLPQAVPIKKLNEAARQDPKMEQEFDLLAEVDAASTPGLFAGPTDVKKRD
jgi:flagellar basal body P-ring protein FlgI